MNKSLECNHVGNTGSIKIVSAGEDGGNPVRLGSEFDLTSVCADLVH
jgi:hypothetical protein